MKKIININLSARLIPIEDSAYEILRQYLDSLRRHFSKEEGAEEIQSDIESRIAELFQDKLKNGAHCITDEDVQAVIASIGRPEQFEEATAGAGQTPPVDETFTTGRRPRKRLYRDPDGKVLGGVCGGLGNYFNVDPVIFRIIFALLFFGAGTGLLVYFILWVATPEANTAAEKLEMRGERVDLNNIRATVQEEINAIKGSVGKVGADIRNFTYGRGGQVGNGIERFFHSLVNVLGKTLVMLTKGIFFFLAVVILFSLIITAVVLAASSAAFFPLKEALVNTPTQSALIWPALTLLIGIPIVALIIFVVRKITGIKQTNRYVGALLGILWIVGLVCAVSLVVSIGKDFRSFAREKENITLKTPSHGKLIVKQGSGWEDDDNMHVMFGDLIVDEDTVIMRNGVEIRSEQGTTDSFQVVISKTSRGRTMSDARRLAQEIAVNIRQEDSVLYVPKDFAIPHGSRWRGQDVTVTVYYPQGKSVDLQDVSNSHHFHIHNGDVNVDDDGDIQIDADHNKIRIRTDHNDSEHPTDSLHEHFRYHKSESKPADEQRQDTPVDNSTKSKDVTVNGKVVGLQATTMVLYSLYHMLKS